MNPIQSDAKIRDLINNTEIYIMPSMNPDGSELRQRGNANNYDLNRNFPDFTTRDNQNTPDGRQVETQAVMNFQKSKHFALSANFHGGAEVVNYPWDTERERHPQDQLINSFSLAYADLVPYLRNSQSFPNGVTNGYDWYHLDGGMQDWSSYYHNDLQVTIEVSSSKWPRYNLIEQYYLDNRDALVKYLEKVQQGAGFSFDNKELNGDFELFRLVGEEQISLGNFSYHRGEFYKVLLPGRYLFSLNSNKQANQQFEISVEPDHIYPNGNYHFFTLSMI